MDVLDRLRSHSDGPGIDRVRHGVTVRSLRVAETDLVTPGMLRVLLSGDELAGFTSLGFDDHVKLVVPAGEGRTERRDYTPRRHDPAAGTLAIDFALHDAGPATRWAMAARPGDVLEVAGPKGSAVVSPNVRRWLLVGDETALPAIGRRIEEAEAGTEITSIVAVAGPEEEQAFDTAAELTVHWAHRPLPAASDPAGLLAALRRTRLRPDTFVWIAAEAGVARAVRDVVLGEMNHSRGWIKAAGYWVLGRTNAHEKLG